MEVNYLKYTTSRVSRTSRSFYTIGEVRSFDIVVKLLATLESPPEGLYCPNLDPCFLWKSQFGGILA